MARLFCRSVASTATHRAASCLLSVLMGFRATAASANEWPAIGGRLINANFAQAAGGRFVGWDPVGAYTAEQGVAAVRCDAASPSAGLVQVVKCDPPVTEPFTASAWARAEDVGPGGDFAVWLDLIHADGSPSWGHIAGFRRGTHEWEKAAVEVVPVKPVAEIRFHLLLRNTTGRAWFSRPAITATPLRLLRVEATAGLWGPRSLALRVETNRPAAIEVRRAGAASSEDPLAKASGRVLTANLVDAVGRDRIELTARALPHGDGVIRQEIHPRAADGSAGPTKGYATASRPAGGDSTPAWRIWVTNVSERIFPDTLPAAWGVEFPTVLDAVRDGHVSVQVCVAASPSGEVAGVDVVPGDLTAEGGRVIPASLWQRFRVGFVRVEQPARHPFVERHAACWWPDPLLPGRPVNVPAGESRSFVLNCRIPRGQAPGFYRGHVAVRAAGKTVREVPLAVRVRDAALPATFRMKTAFALMDGFLEKVYGTITPALRRAYTAFVLDHRLNPDDISRTRLPDLDELAWAKDRGLNAFNILNLVPEPKEKVAWVCFAPTDAYTPEFKKGLIERLDAFVPELERRGLLDRAYVYGFDERGPEYLPIIREYFGLIKERYPRVKTLSTCWPPDGTDPLSLHCDWYCPLSNKYDPVAAQRLRARGGEMWWYVCMGPGYPYANWLLEHPLIEGRLVGWQAWQQRVDGFLYWGLNIWDKPHNDRPIADDADERLPWSVTPFEPLHGDGVLLYPGTNGPIGSLRLLAIRDGLEDAAILDAAERTIGRKRTERIAADVSRGMTDFTRNADVPAAARRHLLDLLEARAATPAILGYVDDIPPEEPEAREARHRLIAERRRGVPILVHRGASTLAPENTLEAYAAAMDCGADGIEIDIRRSADGVLYILHDDTLDRVTRGSGPVKGLPYYELLQHPFKGPLGTAGGDTRIPTLAAVLLLARQRAALLHLDIKEPGIEEDLIRMLDAADVWDHIVEINAYNSDRIRRLPQVRLLRYKGWFPQGPYESDPAAVQDCLSRPGDMVICKDPRPAVRGLKRRPPSPMPLPQGIHKVWPEPADGMQSP